MKSRSIRDERGVALAAALGMLAAAMLMILASFTAVTGDLPLARGDQDRKEAYGAAEAGLAYYQFHLNADNTYWTDCDSVPDPDPAAGNQNPVNQQWNGSGADPRRWRFLPNSTRLAYTIELIPAPGYTTCSTTNEASMIDPTTNTFRIRATGRDGTNGAKRSIVASFKRQGFVDYLWFTDYETFSPLIYDSSSDRAWAATNCVRYKYQGRVNQGGNDPCEDLQWPDYDQVLGPFHSNDSIYVCGDPQFGRNSSDNIEAHDRFGSCSADPIGPGTWKPDAGILAMPTTNSSLATSAGRIYTGKTTIVLGDTSMTVTNPNQTPNTQNNVAYPANGLIYVQAGSGSCSSYDGDYVDENACANVYLRGNYTSDLTIASGNDVIINGNIIRNSDGDNEMLGLIPQNFARVYHPVSSDCDDNTTGYLQNVTIHAAILALNHSFLVDKWKCGDELGDLTVDGSIAQKFRGPVGQVNSAGYHKVYTYDDSLKYRDPPFFMQPDLSTWTVRRQVEQSPAR